MRATGRLVEFTEGLLSGELRLDAPPAEPSGLTVEFLAQGVAFDRRRVSISPQTGLTQVFNFKLRNFPEVATPCDLRARIVETGVDLEGAVHFASFEEVWRRMTPFRAWVEEVGREAIVVVAEGPGAAEAAFLLRARGEPLDFELSPEPADSGRRLLRPPAALMNGAERLFSVVHRQSGLPLHSAPLSFGGARQPEAQEPAAAPAPSDPRLEDLARRVERLEREAQSRLAEAFNAMAAPFYRHVDAMAMNQRENFEREIAAIRELLGLGAAAPKSPAPPQEVLLNFGEPIMGYGLHEVQYSATGKPHRYVASACGFLLPGLAPAGEAVLKAQGLRRARRDALDGVKLILNGREIPCSLYLNPKSESWNIESRIAKGGLRPDRNLVELRLPKSAPDRIGDLGAADLAASIQYVSISAAPA